MGCDFQYIYCTKFLNIFNENNKTPSVYIFVLTVERGQEILTSYQWCKKDKKESVADLSNYLWKDQVITLVHIKYLYLFYYVINQMNKLKYLGL